MGLDLKQLILKRVVINDELTQGVLCADNHALCVTLEDPWQDNQRNISCIPQGVYQVKTFTGTRFKDVWQIMDVPGRSYILIHAGNSVLDTHGCVLVGRSFNARTIQESRNALEYLRHVLPDEFELEIINA